MPDGLLVDPVSQEAHHHPFEINYDRGCTMVFLSELMNKPVVDASGNLVGRLSDLVADSRELFPRVISVVIATMEHGPRQVQKRHVAPSALMGDVDWHAIHLKRDLDAVFSPVPSSLDRWTVSLCRDVLDKQVVDAEGRRIAKVNDLWLADASDTLRLAAIDISAHGFLRRLGALGAIALVQRVVPIALPERMILWSHVAAVSAQHNELRLKVVQSRLPERQGADIADIVATLAAADGRAA